MPIVQIVVAASTVGSALVQLLRRNGTVDVDLAMRSQIVSLLRSWGSPDRMVDRELVLVMGKFGGRNLGVEGGWF